MFNRPPTHEITDSPVELHREAGKATAAQFLRNLIAAVPYAIHTVLTDNGIQFTNMAHHK